MNPVSKDIVDMLEAYGDSSGFSLGLVFANNLHVGKEPADPANCVTIYDVSGFGTDLGLTDKSYERPSIQIRVRNTKYWTAMGIAQEIKDSLHGRSHETWNGSLYTVIKCTSGPALLDYDDNGCTRIVLNLDVQRRPA